VSAEEPIIDLEQLLHPNEQEQFRRLCLATSEEDLAALPELVELHLAQLTTEAGPRADLETAEAIGRSLLALLASGVRFDDQQRALIRGAVEYFLLVDDASGDLDDVLGFDDDVRVLNSVLERIGQPRFRVDLG
jgi:uncharacterized membrane protein YkvA (DUF1232 family)